MRFIITLLKFIFFIPMICNQAVASQPSKANIISFKALQKSDLPMLFDWFNQPYIALLWKEPKDWSIFQNKWAKNLAEINRFSFIAYFDQEPFAYIQYYRNNCEDRTMLSGANLPEGTVGIDLFIGKPQLLNKGHGTRLLTEFIDYIKYNELACSTIIIDPAPDNDRAIACYTKVGFVPVGTFVVPYGPTGDGPGEVMLMRYEIKR